MTEFLPIEKICRDPWMSGRIVIEDKKEQILIRKRTYPLAVFLFCSAIMGGLLYCIYRFVNGELIAAASSILAPVMVAVFTSVAWWLDRKPPILIFNPTTRCLMAPRYPDHCFCMEESAITIIPALVSREDTIYCQILAVNDGGEEIPVFCEQSRKLHKPAIAFSKRIGVGFEFAPQQKID